MTDGVGECRFFPVQDFVRQIVALKSVTKQIFSDSVGVLLFLRIDRKNVLYEIQIAERNPCLQGLRGDAPVGTQDIVFMQFPDPFFGFLLEFLGGRGKIGVFIAE